MWHRMHLTNTFEILNNSFKNDKVLFRHAHFLSNLDSWLEAAELCVVESPWVEII